MARQNIGIGSVVNDGTGDSLRVAGDKINFNFIELYNQPYAKNSVVTFAELATEFGYTGSGRNKIVAAGDIIQVLTGDSFYTVLAAGASGADLDYTGTGGIKVNLRVEVNGYMPAQAGGDLAAIFAIACIGAKRTGVDYSGALPSIWLPPGNYTLNTGIQIGSGQTGNVPAFKLAAIPGTVRVVVADGIDAITIKGGNANPDTYISGITFVGGNRHIRFEGTGVTVVARKIIRDCKFIDFSISAISSEQDDSPYWDITGNTFQAKTGVANTVSIALGGLLDNSFICKNTFLRSWIDVVIDGGTGGGISGTLSIEENDFIHFGGVTKRANIWFIPGDTATGSNSGWATTVSRNKFGNENYANGWSRVLVAMHTGTGARDTYDVSTTFNGGRSVAGLIVEKNRFSSYSGAPGQYIIESYAGKLHGWTFSDNFLSVPTFAVFFQGVSDPTAMPWRIGENRAEGSGAPTAPWRRFSNYPVGVVPGGFQQIAGVEVPSTSSMEVGFVNATPALPALFSGATRTVITGGDVFGGDNLFTITCPIALSGIAQGLVGTVTNATQVVAQVDLRRAATNSLDFVEVYWNIDGSKQNSHIVELTSTTQTVEIRGVLPAGATYRQLVIIPSGFAAGTKDSFVMGRLIGPVETRGTINGGHIRTLATGAWNSGHIVMGNYRLWIDASGRLRIKSGAPTSDTDGTIVGTQS